MKTTFSTLPSRPPRGRPSRDLFRRVARVCFCLLALVIVAAGILEAYVIANPQKALTIDSGNVTADAMVVLGGEFQERARRAAELYASGAAPRILVSGRSDYLPTVAWLEKSGVPASVITLEPRSDSTYENAAFSVPLLQRMGAKRVIIVTSWYHSRRALACFRHFSSDIQFFSRPDYAGFTALDPATQKTQGYVQWEEIKLPAYWLFHGVCPL